MDSLVRMGPQNHNSRREAMFSQPETDPRAPVAEHPSKKVRLLRGEGKRGLSWATSEEY